MDLTHCLPTKTENKKTLSKLQKENNTNGRKPCASEVPCLFWLYLKSATKTGTSIKPAIYLFPRIPSSPPLSHTSTGDSRQCRVHYTEGTRTTLKTASAQQQTQQARRSVCHVFNYACCTALHSPVSQGNCTFFTISPQVFCRFPRWPCNVTSLDKYSMLAKDASGSVLPDPVTSAAAAAASQWALAFIRKRFEQLKAN